MAFPPALRTLQRVSLFGYGYAPPGADQIEYTPYAGQGLGASLAPYDLNAPGAVAEVKRALRSLGEAESDPFRKAQSDVVTEKIWQGLTDDDTWDQAAAEEFLLAMSRYGGKLGVGEPYVQQGLPGGGPQPAVNGLETLAGAVNQRLGGAPKMALYEAWRKGGCLVQATCFDPPSAISKPADGTPVLRTQQSGNRLVPPPSAAPALLQTLAGFDAQEQAAWKVALAAQTEAERASAAELMQKVHANRDAAAQAAIDSAPGRTGTTTLDTRMQDCLAQGGTWDPNTGVCKTAAAPPAKASTETGALVVLGLLALGAVWVMRGGKKR